MGITEQEYRKISKKRVPHSPVFTDCLWAFFVGGFLCAVGEAVAQVTAQAGLEEETARLTGSLCLIFLSILLTGLHWYDNIAKHAGAGTSVPITGFANSIASAAQEFKSEGLVLGMAAKMFVIAGPVLVYGITASVVYGVIYWVMTLF